MQTLSASGRGVWSALSEFTKAYLVARAADAIFLGEDVANATFPELHGCEIIVGSVKELYRHKEQSEEEKWRKEERERIERECEGKVALISPKPPACLEPKVLKGSESEKARGACIRQLSQDENARRVAATIDVFAVFCKRLAQPENHIKGRCANTRTEADMVNEMARELVGLPNHMAYARVVQGAGGEQGTWKGEMRTERI
jgi:hypothetical protein